MAPDLRVSDADREAVADLLKRHYADGRLTDHELATRIDAAYRARVESQLAELVTDLPDLDSSPPPAPHRSLRTRMLVVGVAFLTTLALLAASMPDEMWLPFMIITVPMLAMLAVMLAPMALAALGIVWISRALRGPQRRRLNV